MFRSILLPTDGSTLSTRAAKYAVELAASTRARVTAPHVGAVLLGSETTRVLAHSKVPVRVCR